MDPVMMKLIELKSNVPMDIINGIIKPYVSFQQLTNKNIKSAVELYFSNQSECEKKFGPIEKWNVELVTDMQNLFKNKINFNADISEWNVRNVTDMSGMFCCTDFNADISKWNVQNCKNMSHMFHAAEKFNADISKWNVENVENMSWMFCCALSFNQDLENWNVINVKTDTNMTLGAMSFLEWNEPKIFVDRHVALLKNRQKLKSDLKN